MTAPIVYQNNADIRIPVDQYAHEQRGTVNALVRDVYEKAGQAIFGQLWDRLAEHAEATVELGATPVSTELAVGMTVPIQWGLTTWADGSRRMLPGRIEEIYVNRWTGETRATVVHPGDDGFWDTYDTKSLMHWAKTHDNLSPNCSQFTGALMYREAWCVICEGPRPV